MVFEYCDHDLSGLLDTDPPITFGAAQIKYYMQCLFEALYYLHNKMHILHRDVKGANILISNNGDVKLADFGLARNHTKKGKYTNRVVTLWYRPPELLLGASEYDDKIDIWSAGCIFAEMLRNGKALFRGSTELDHLHEIYKVCGTPDKNGWTDAATMPWVKKHKPLERRLKEEFSNQDPIAVDLLDHLLQLDPKKRFNASQALDHDYFFTEPEPMKKEDHPTYRQNHHEYESKKRRSTKAQARPDHSNGGRQQGRKTSYAPRNRGGGANFPRGGTGGGSRGNIYQSRRGYQNRTQQPQGYRHHNSSSYQGGYQSSYFGRGRGRGRSNAGGSRGTGQGRAAGRRGRGWAPRSRDRSYPPQRGGYQGRSDR